MSNAIAPSKVFAQASLPYVVEKLSGEFDGNRYVTIACEAPDEAMAREQIELLGWAEVVKYAKRAFGLAKNQVAVQAGGNGTREMSIDENGNDLGSQFGQAFSRNWNDPASATPEPPTGKKPRLAVQYQINNDPMIG
jgi:hypothetical protein